MDLKNYLLEYVSSGRRKLNSSHPVEPDTILKAGDIVRIKDKEWFDSLEKMSGGTRIVHSGDTTISFTHTMAKYLGYKVVIVNTRQMYGYLEPRYRVRLCDDGNSRELVGYVFSNEMLEYI